MEKEILINQIVPRLKTSCPMGRVPKNHLFVCFTSKTCKKRVRFGGFPIPCVGRYLAFNHPCAEEKFC
jgi:hypothetical protein